MLLKVGNYEDATLRFDQALKVIVNSKFQQSLHILAQYRRPRPKMWGMQRRGLATTHTLSVAIAELVTRPVGTSLCAACFFERFLVG